MPYKLDDEEIIQRIKLGDAQMRRQRNLDRYFAAKYHNADMLPADDGMTGTEWDDEYSVSPLDYQPVGITNAIATNILTKTAAVAYGRPDFRVVCLETLTDDEDSNAESELVRKWLTSTWINKNWRRESNKCAMQRWIGGIGFVAYRWDEKKGETFEFIPSRDFGVDPNVTNWQDLRWAWRKVRMPLREARERYPWSDEIADRSREADAESMDSRPAAIEITIYHDVDSVHEEDGEKSLGIEAHIFEEEVLWRGKNLYERVPYLIFEGDISPGPTVFPIGDMQLASGLQEELLEVQTLISNKAKHGGPVTLYDQRRFDESSRRALKDGKTQQWIGVKDTSQPPVIRVPGEEITQAELEARRTAMNAIDSVTGIGQYQRGVVEEKPAYAAEVAYMSQQTGARASIARKEYEEFIDKWAAIAVWLHKTFGGPQIMPDGSDMPTEEDELILWNALQKVVEVQVIEGSTTFRDPSMEQQQAMQLFQMMAQNFPLFLQMYQGGLTTELPNMTRLYEDVMRAFGRQNTDDYKITVPPLTMSAVPPGGGEGTEGTGEGPPATSPPSNTGEMNGQSVG